MSEENIGLKFILDYYEIKYIIVPDDLDGDYSFTECIMVNGNINISTMNLKARIHQYKNQDYDYIKIWGVWDMCRVLRHLVKEFGTLDV
jgi:hypothetical protein